LAFRGQDFQDNGRGKNTYGWQVGVIGDVEVIIDTVGEDDCGNICQPFLLKLCLMSRGDLVTPITSSKAIDHQNRG